MPLGLAIGQFIVLASIIGFAHYAIRTPGMQTLAYVWGLSNGWLLLAILIGLPADDAPVGMPVVGKWLLGITRTLISPPVPRPDWDWFTDDKIAWAWWIIAIAAVYWYVTRLHGVRLPRLTLSQQPAARGGRTGAPKFGKGRGGANRPPAPAAVPNGAWADSA